MGAFETMKSIERSSVLAYDKRIEERGLKTLLAKLTAFMLFMVRICSKLSRSLTCTKNVLEEP